jgi:hypothetical protein
MLSSRAIEQPKARNLLLIFQQHYAEDLSSRAYCDIEMTAIYSSKGRAIEKSRTF